MKIQSWSAAPAASPVRGAHSAVPSNLDTVDWSGASLPPDTRPLGERARQYLVDKARDVATVVAVSLLNPGTLLQNAVSLGISLLTTGDRRTGQYGFALYENCRGLGRLIGQAVLDTSAFTPGPLGFAAGRLSQRVMDHENQHALQSLVTGPLYYPGLAFEAVRAGLKCGFNSDCIHDISVFELDAKRAEKVGLHFPFIPWPTP
ncbi:MAG: hypothetical protein AB1758_17215 [Candidatus Eremiobacterota bacterium]